MRRHDFARVRRRGRRLDSADLIVQAAPVPGNRPPRIAVVCAKAIGSAVERNRARRRVRAALDSLDLTGNQFDIIVTARPSARTAKFARLVADLGALLGRL